MGEKSKMDEISRGTKLRLKNDEREWVYRGWENGRIMLVDPPLGVTLMVKKEDVDWESCTRPKV